MIIPEAIAAKIVSAEEARRILDETVGSVALTNGCFDLLHPGHVLALNDAKAQGDLLVVLVNSDASVRELKPGRPIYDQDMRATMLASLESVDLVVIFDGTDCAAEIREIRPDVYVKGEEYRENQNPAEAAALREVGAEIRWQPRVGSWSTTNLIAACARLSHL